jgi:hypothetical protein
MFQFVVAGLLASLFAYLSYSQKKEGYLIFSFVILWYIAAFQDCIASDFISYKTTFEDINLSYMKGVFLRRSEFPEDGMEIGWYILNKGIAYFSNTFYVVTPIVYGIIFYSFYKLIQYAPSKWRWVAIFYFYFTPGWMTSIMSAQRQSVAIAFWILLVIALLNKEYIKAVIFTIIGISFHNSMLYSLPFLLLLLLPLDKINFNRSRAIWFSIFIIIFFIGYLYVQELVEGVSMLFDSLDSEAVKSYAYYIQELEQTDLTSKWTTIIFRLILYVFIIWSFIFSERKSANSSLFYILFIISYNLIGSMGGYGSFARIFRYIMFTSLPAVSNTAFRLNKPARYVFIGYMIFSSLYSFNAAVHTEQFANYLNYRTIFF